MVIKMDIKQMAGSVFETIIKIVVLFILVRFVYNAAIKAYDYGYRVFAEEPMTTGDGRTISINVKEEDSVKDIGENLADKGLIRDANLFFVQELLSEYHGKIKPGIYDLNTSMGSDEMMAIMSAEPEEGEGEGASTDNVPMERPGTEDTEGAGEAGGMDGAGGNGGTDGAGEAGGMDGTGGTDGIDGAGEPGGADE